MTGESGASSRSVTAKLDVRGSQYGLQLSASPEAKLSAILEIMKNLGRAVTLDEVLPKVLDTLFTIFIQADRGFIVLNDDEGQLKPKWVENAAPRPRRNGASFKNRSARSDANQRGDHFSRCR